MLVNLALGTFVIALTVVIHTWGLIAVTHLMRELTSRFHVHGHRSRTLAMVTTVIGIFCIITVEVWVWAAFHFGLGSFEDFETALYFSTVTFSTLGYGDVVPAPEWRLFAALESVDGLLLIGWSTAYLIAAGIRIGPFRSGEHF
ncbi:MAG: potassium channel family protein [Mesorhizobium sp.]